MQQTYFMRSPDVSFLQGPALAANNFEKVERVLEPLYDVIESICELLVVHVAKLPGAWIVQVCKSRIEESANVIDGSSGVEVCSVEEGEECVGRMNEERAGL